MVSVYDVKCHKSQDLDVGLEVYYKTVVHLIRQDMSDTTNILT